MYLLFSFVHWSSETVSSLHALVLGGRNRYQIIYFHSISLRVFTPPPPPLISASSISILSLIKLSFINIITTVHLIIFYTHFHSLCFYISSNSPYSRFLTIRSNSLTQLQRSSIGFSRKQLINLLLSLSPVSSFLHPFYQFSSYFNFRFFIFTYML